eukprot:GHRR01006203.1.p1 GENE.GHRR01006203.1~~GHRR01006203.1.p1  ORF type:complete len:359 (+),score=158.67 GHRR01006203.1:1460-2536(+)
MAGGEDLYQMLNLGKTASQAEVKKAYYKLALQWHPDRNPAPEATAKFQALQRIYDVLSDPVKRQLYDQTGSLQDCEEMVQGGNFRELYAAFREAMKVTEEDLDTFAVTYRGSGEERADLLKFYTDFNGDMPKVFEWLMLSRPELDSHRFRATLEQAITAGDIKPTKVYKKWSAKVAATLPPTADPLAPPIKADSNSKKGKSSKEAENSQALVTAIKSKERAFTGMLAALEAKYSGAGDSTKGKGKRKKHGAAGAELQPAEEPSSKKWKGKRAAGKVAIKAATADDSENVSEVEQYAEPTEEEFAAARARLEHKHQGSKATGKHSSDDSNTAKGKQWGKAGVEQPTAQQKAGKRQQKKV